MKSEDDSPLLLLDFDWIRQAAGRPNLSARDCLLEQDVVGPNALFDPAFYRCAYGATLPGRMTCLEHFCAQARETPCDPNPLFSVRQWHNTVGAEADAATWRRTLFDLLRQEADFAREQLARWQAGDMVVHDEIVGAPPQPGQEIVLFAHDQTHPELVPYVYDYLDALVEQGTCLMFLCSSAVTSAASQQLAGRVWRVVQTRNRAREWGLYRIGVHLLEQADLTDHPVILVNDRVVGTMTSLTPLFKRARAGVADLVGAIDGGRREAYLASFFLYCTARLVQSPAWREFWRAWRPQSDEHCRFNSHACGFSRFMRAQRVTMQTVWRVDAMLCAGDAARAHAWRNDAAAELDPMQVWWDVMLECGFPFVDQTIFTARLEAPALAHMTRVLARLAVHRRRPFV